MHRSLFWIARRNLNASQETPALIVEPCRKKSTSRIPFLFQDTVHMIFRDEVACLNSVFVAMKCASTPGTAVSVHGLRATPTMTSWLKKLSASPLFRVKVQRIGLPFQFVFFRKHLWHPVCTQFSKLVYQTFS